METEEAENVIDEESHDSDINVIPVHLVGPYEVSSPTNSSNIVRGKYYKQTYRPAWEQMPDFKGWLRGVEGEPTRAYCTYCQKTLHAHRLSLLKHTCTIRHQKAAQMHSTRKNKSQIVEHHEVQTVVINNDTFSNDDMEGEEGETIVEYAEAPAEIEDAEQDIEHDHDDDEETESVSVELHNVPFQKHYHQHSVQTAKPPISTQVIDATRGVPVAGLQVSLYKLIDGRWTYINEGVTNTSGRFSQFLDRADFHAGRYKLHFDVDRYFESRKQESLFPFIEIVFDSAFSSSYHIPVMLSPFGYTTYCGS